MRPPEACRSASGRHRGRRQERSGRWIPNTVSGDVHCEALRRKWCVQNSTALRETVRFESQQRDRADPELLPRVQMNGPAEPSPAPAGKRGPTGAAASFQFVKCKIALLSSLLAALFSRPPFSRESVLGP